MDHLGIDKFMVMGFCIGGPFIWSLLKRAPNRVAAAVLAQPVGWRPEMRDPKYPGVFWRTWGPALTAKRPEITMQTTDKFVTRMFETNPDFVFTVTRDFVRGCQTPILVLPDDVPAHPYAVAMEMRDARAERRSEHVPLERTQGADSPGGAPDSFLPQGASACLAAGGDHPTADAYPCRCRTTASFSGAHRSAWSPAPAPSWSWSRFGHLLNGANPAQSIGLAEV